MKARKCPERKSTMADLNDKLNELTNTEDSTSSYSPEDINNNKAMAILAYLSWLVLIPLFAARESPFARFHVNQGLALAIVEIICWIVFGILSKIPIIGWLFVVVEWLVSLACLILAILGIVNAVNGRAKELPVVGKFRILK